MEGGPWLCLWGNSGWDGAGTPGAASWGETHASLP